MKETYRFVGVVSTVGDVDLKKFGQKIDLTKEEAETAIRGGAALIPDVQFRDLMFTDKELRDYALAGQQVNASAEFREKKQRAHEIFREILAALEHVAVAAVTVAVERAFDKEDK